MLRSAVGSVFWGEPVGQHEFVKVGLNLAGMGRGPCYVWRWGAAVCRAVGVGPQSLERRGGPQSKSDDNDDADDDIKTMVVKITYDTKRLAGSMGTRCKPRRFIVLH